MFGTHTKSGLSELNEGVSQDIFEYVALGRLNTDW